MDKLAAYRAGAERALTTYKAAALLPMLANAGRGALQMAQRNPGRALQAGTALAGAGAGALAGGPDHRLAGALGGAAVGAGGGAMLAQNRGARRAVGHAMGNLQGMLPRM